MLGILLGLFISFVDSYSYAVSGFTTAEISVIIVPLLLLIISQAFKLGLSKEELVIASATAIGIDITTTLTAGMYITYGFLAYSAKQLKEFGLLVVVPSQLFSLLNQHRGFVDYCAMPTYIALTLVSIGGAFLAYALRMHYIERERLLYPLGIAAAMIIKSIRKIKPSYVVALLIGFLAQIASLKFSTMVDLTPLTSSIVPGSVLALSLSPLMIALFMLLPLGSLKLISIGSLTTYVLLLPFTIALLNLPVTPMMSYEDALFAYSNVIASIVIGVIVVLSAYYVLIYRKVFRQSFLILLHLAPERTAFLVGIALVSLIVPIALAIATQMPPLILMVFVILTVLALHILLILVNLRAVGETGIGSQAVLPLVTFSMYLARIRDVGLYAALDPFTGIPMPQVVGGTAMNVIRFSRLNGVRASRALLAFVIGMLLGSFATYIYGNILVAVYGFDSPQMPLYRWIPTVVWMAVIYSGSREALYVQALLIGVILGFVLAILNSRKGVAVFPIVIGATLPPDIGLTALVVYVIKSTLIRMGVEVHERALLLSILALLGCGLAVLVYTLILGV